MNDAALLTRLQFIADQVHVAMHSMYGRPDPFVDRVAVSLMEFESDLDPNLVFKAVLRVASRSDVDALAALFPSREQ